MKNTNNGIGFFGLLAIAFIILKIVGVISWSWLWVLAPIWGSIGLLVIIGTIAVICSLMSDKR